jgi:hypothetical protein
MAVSKSYAKTQKYSIKNLRLNAQSGTITSIFAAYECSIVRNSRMIRAALAKAA